MKNVGVRFADGLYNDHPPRDFGKCRDNATTL